MAFSTYFRPLKMQFDEDEKAMFQVVTNHWGNIFFLLTSP